MQDCSTIVIDEGPSTRKDARARDEYYSDHGSIRSTHDGSKNGGGALGPPGDPAVEPGGFGSKRQRRGDQSAGCCRVQLPGTTHHQPVREAQCGANEAVL